MFGLKLAIVTNAVYPELPEYVKKTDELKQIYCQRLGLTTVGNTADYIRTAINYAGLNPMWSKPRILLGVIKNYDWIIWMDADAAPINHTFNVINYLNSTNGDRVIMAKDVLNWNSGVFAIPNNRKCIEWLECIQSHELNPQYQNRWGEQGAMIDSFNNGWGWIVMEPSKEIGWNQYLNLYERDNDPNIYKPGDWCLHLPDVRDDYRADIFNSAQIIW